MADFFDLEAYVGRWRTFGATGIPYVESVSNPVSPEYEFRQDGTRAVRTLYCPWDSVWEFTRVILGYPEVVYESAGKGSIRRNLPDAMLQFQNSSSDLYIWAREVQRVEGIGVPTRNSAGISRMKDPFDVARHGLAKVQVLYDGGLPYDIVHDAAMPLDPHTGGPDESSLLRYIYKQVQPVAEAVAIPTGSLYLVDGDADTATTSSAFPHKLQPGYNLQLTWYFVPTAACGTRLINESASSFPWDDALGKVNSTEWIECPVGTLLLEAISPQPIRSAIGDRLWNVTFHFKYFSPDDENAQPAGSPTTHSHLLRPDGAIVRYTEVVAHSGAAPVVSNLVTQAAGVSIYDYYEMRDLFRVPRPA